MYFTPENPKETKLVMTYQKIEEYCYPVLNSIPPQKKKKNPWHSQITHKPHIGGTETNRFKGREDRRQAWLMGKARAQGS